MSEPIFQSIQVLCCKNPYRRIFTTSPCSALQCDGFTEFPGNPVYNPYPTSLAYYQTVRYDRLGFAPYGVPAFYAMWYDVSSSGGIALATSPDGINWTFIGLGTGFRSVSPNARHSRVLFDRDGFGIGVPYRIWYWDSAFVTLDPLTPAVLRMLRTAYSTDGLHWFDDTTLTQDLSSPLVTIVYSPNVQCYGPGDVLFFPENPAILDLTTPFNNRYVMYYNVSDGNIEQLALAVSADGVFWRMEGPMPVLSVGAPGSWDEVHACQGTVVLKLGPNQFHMLYSGGVDSSHEGIGCALSSDGLNWVKYFANPIFSIFDGVTWRSSRTYNPWVLFDPQRFSGHGDAVCFKLWLTGAPAADPSDIDIGYGTQ